MGKVMTKINKGLKNNSGFTLIELLTSLTIFAFFSIALLQYMKTASSIQSQVGANVKLETDVQTAMGVVEEFLIDASASVVFDDASKTLLIFNNKSYDETNTSTGPVVHAFTWYESDYTDSGKTYNEGEIYYSTATSGVSKTTTTTTTTVVTRSSVDKQPSVLNPSGADRYTQEEYTKTEVVVVKDGTKVDAFCTTNIDRKNYEYDSDPDDRDEVVAGRAYNLSDIPLLTPDWSEERKISSVDESTFSGLWNASGTIDSSKLVNAEKLCENISAFNVDLDISSAGRIISCTLSFKMGNYRDTNTGKITVAEYEKDLFIVMRNNPPEGILIV